MPDTDVAAIAGREPSITDEIPYIRKVGRYLFFAVCAVGISLEAFALFRHLGVVRDIALMAGNVCGFACFLALRDMSKAWDIALMERAEAVRQYLQEQGRG